MLTAVLKLAKRVGSYQHTVCIRSAIGVFSVIPSVVLEALTTAATPHSRISRGRPYLLGQVAVRPTLAARSFFVRL
jgi:hypothetical protein